MYENYPEKELNDNLDIIAWNSCLF